MRTLFTLEQEGSGLQALVLADGWPAPRIVLSKQGWTEETLRAEIQRSYPDAFEVGHAMLEVRRRMSTEDLEQRRAAALAKMDAPEMGTLSPQTLPRIVPMRLFKMESASMNRA